MIANTMRVEGGADNPFHVLTESRTHEPSHPFAITNIIVRPYEGNGLCLVVVKNLPTLKPGRAAQG